MQSKCEKSCFLPFKASAIKIILVLQTTFFMTPIWLQICAKQKWATQRIQIISEEKFLYIHAFFTNFEYLKTFFFDVRKKKHLVKTQVYKNALSEI